MNSKTIKLIVVLLIMASGCKMSESGLFLGLGKKPSATKEMKKDSTDGKKEAPKAYDKVISEEAVTEKGLFTVHKVDGQWFFEVPDSLMGRDILMMTTINRAVAGKANGDKLYNGEEISNHVVRFEKGPDNNLFIRTISISAQSTDTTANGMYHSVRNANLQPIIAAFDIKAISPDSSAVVIDPSDFINGDNELLFFSKEAKSKAGIKRFQKDLSYTKTIKTFPLNLEVYTIKTYASAAVGSADANTFELNSSFSLLPKLVMKPRYSDPRVGYVASPVINFDENPQGVKTAGMINRWRLEPRPEDRSRYMRGELVEPAHPIVFYIDPAAPKKWVPYLKQGVNDWQKAFEQAGFKNAIYAVEAPTGDAEWSLNDARHNAIVYNASTGGEAKGSYVHDPRSGEILSAHINWHHNIISYIRPLYMVMAGAIDPKAQTLVFEESLMGRLIRAVCAREIGHLLGLQDNYGSSSTIPTDSLRKKSWVEAHGHTPSIMDSAMFNYVAQPEDNISEEGIMPRIGSYDKWAIEWGYRWFPDFQTKGKENDYLNEWIIKETSKNSHLWFGGKAEGRRQYDPRRQATDLGDDIIKSASYGIQNLKRIVPHLLKWTKDETDHSYGAWQSWQWEVIWRYYDYLDHVEKIVGGVEWTDKSMSQPGVQHNAIPRERQKEAVAFLQDQLFSKPFDWVYQVGEKGSIFSYSWIPSGSFARLFQKRFLERLMSFEKLLNINKVESEFAIKEQYTVIEYLNDIKAGIWGGLKERKPINEFKRNVQKIHAEQLALMAYPREREDGIFISSVTAGKLKKMTVDGNYAANTDVMSIVRWHKQQLIEEIDKALPYYKDELSILHLTDVRDRLKTSITSKENAARIYIQPTTLNIDNIRLNRLLERNKQGSQNCWDNDLP